MYQKKLLKIILTIGLVCTMSISFCSCKKAVEDDKTSEIEEELIEEPSRAELIAADRISDASIAIYSAEELMAIPEGTSNSYYLANDIDMGGLIWTPKDFNGHFDGYSHTISNLSIDGCGSGIAQTYDGNMKVYDTSFCGLFGILDGATVENFTLESVSLKCATEYENVFAGIVAGFMNDATVKNINISGTGYLETSSKCFGIGGIAGYGNGLIENCNADITLVCIDNNAEEKDEQFMGGAYAAGYIDIVSNIINIDGYDSDHGYVHNGGLVGMYMQYDVDTTGHIDNNSVNGRIKFFEDNRDRRAYCAPYVGEIVTWTLTMDGNHESFTRDEVFEYTKNLLPE